MRGTRGTWPIRLGESELRLIQRERACAPEISWANVFGSAPDLEVSQLAVELALGAEMLSRRLTLQSNYDTAPDFFCLRASIRHRTITGPMHKICLVTGWSGVIGSEATACFHESGFKVHGVDNKQREKFFGPQGNTRWNQERLQRTLKQFAHHELDIRNRLGVEKLVKLLIPAVIIHTAAQPEANLRGNRRFLA